MNLNEILPKVWEILNARLFELNQTPITAMTVIGLLVVLLIFHLGSKLLARMTDRVVFTRVNMENSTRFTLLRAMHYLIMVIGVLVAFQAVGIDLSGLAMIFGLLSVGIGFGLQNLTSNFISGLILLIEQPIKVGDRVTVGETEGDVVDIAIRSTRINTLDNLSIIVPNSEFISNRVVNWSHGDRRVRAVIEVGVSYDSDVDLVMQTLKEIAENHPDVLSDPAPDVILRSFGDSSWNMQLRAWFPDTRSFHNRCSDMNCEIVRRFRQRGIEIPYPQRDLHLRSSTPIPLSGNGDNQPDQSAEN